MIGSKAVGLLDSGLSVGSRVGLSTTRGADWLTAIGGHGEQETGWSSVHGISRAAGRGRGPEPGIWPVRDDSHAGRGQGQLFRPAGPGYRQRSDYRQLDLAERDLRPEHHDV